MTTSNDNGNCYSNPQQPTSKSGDERPSPFESARKTRDELRAEALGNGEERAFHLANHPLNQQPVKVLTKSIQEAFLSVCEHVKYKRPGCCFNADFRFGKSTAVSMITNTLSSVIPEIACHLVSAKYHDLVTEKIFWGDVLIAMGLSILGTGQARQDRVRTAMTAACVAAGGRHFVLFIDEGQNWGAREFTWIRDLANQLQEQDGHNLTTVTFGDLRLAELSAAFRANRKDLWGRFLLKPKRFSGIRDVEDLQFFLSEYDNVCRSEYPAGSGVSYTEFFVPKAFATGWRLGAEAENLWDAFARAAAKVNRKPDEIGMQWVGESVIHLLMEKMQDDVSGLTTGSSDWDRAVARAVYIDSLT